MAAVEQSSELICQTLLSSCTYQQWKNSLQAFQAYCFVELRNSVPALQLKLNSRAYWMFSFSLLSCTNHLTNESALLKHSAREYWKGMHLNLCDLQSVCVCLQANSVHEFLCVSPLIYQRPQQTDMWGHPAGLKIQPHGQYSVQSYSTAAATAHTAIDSGG